MSQKYIPAAILVILAGFYLVSSAAGRAADTRGVLKPALFESQIIVWRSVGDLERAVDIIAGGRIKDGDFDELMECWADANAPATLIRPVSDGYLLLVRLKDGNCEGVIFAEEFVADR